MKWIFPALLLAFFAWLTVTRQTIAPVDIYTITPQLYEPGAAARVRNSYLIDITTVYLPWKYYLGVEEPKACAVDVTSPIGTKAVGGVALPQGVCYPLEGVRKYIYSDLFFFLRKFLSFFDAYNWSYLALLTGIYLAALAFFWVFFSDQTLGVLGAVLLTASFPVARDLQYDGFSQALPFLLVSLAFQTLVFRKTTKPMIWLVLSLVFLLLASFKSSLQTLGMAPFLWVAFGFIWNFEFLADEKHALPANRLKIYGPILAGLCAVMAAGAWYHSSAIQIFLHQTDKFLPRKDVSIPGQIASRSGVWLMSLVHFLTGDWLVSFDTVDFSKIFGPLGARENTSYDGNAFFINPALSALVALVLIGGLRWGGSSRSLFKKVAAVLIVDYLVIQLPFYRFFYFRFHQWWLLINVLLIVGVTFQEWPPKFGLNLKKWLPLAGVLLAVAIITTLLVSITRGHLLTLMDHRGILGFEEGFWALRLDRWLRRLIFMDWYSLAELATIAIVFWAFAKRKLKTGVAALSVSGILLNTFHYNQPQPVAPFENFRAALKNKAGAGAGFTMPGNVNLLVNEGTPKIYESLSIEVKDLEGANR